MGAGQSSSSGNQEKALQDLETKLRGSGDLDILERAFQALSGSSELDKRASISITSLQECLSVKPLAIKEDSSTEQTVEITRAVGVAIVEECFNAKDGKLEWTQMLEGYRNCVQSSGVEHLKMLFAVFLRASRSTPQGQESTSKGQESVDKGDGGLSEGQLRAFIWICWLMMCYARLPINGDAAVSGELQVTLPRIDPLLSGAINACETESKRGLVNVYSISELSSWIFAVIPGLAECMVLFIRASLSRLSMLPKVDAEQKQNSGSTSPTAEKEEAEKSLDDDEEQGMSTKDSLLLHSGTAWAVGLSLRDHSAAEILFQASCGLVQSADVELPSLIYRSSINGRGLNRFWTCVQGYRAPVLVLISAQTKEESSPGVVFVIGALLPGGFENKESSYGASGSCLFSIEPLFCPFRTSGKDKYFVYSHKHTAGAVYRAQPANEGIGFGGGYGKERVWIDQDFATLSVRHHVVDKTYHSGGLVPGQGYSPVDAQVLEVEIWGLGGSRAEQEQSKFLKRENLFSEQRRKVDLAAFGNWENSPEKMMMDMMSNPNSGQRQER